MTSFLSAIDSLVLRCLWARKFQFHPIETLLRLVRSRALDIPPNWHIPQTTDRYPILSLDFLLLWEHLPLYNKKKVTGAALLWDNDLDHTPKGGRGNTNLPHVPIQGHPELGFKGIRRMHLTTFVRLLHSTTVECGPSKARFVTTVY